MLYEIPNLFFSENCITFEPTTWMDHILNIHYADQFGIVILYWYLDDELIIIKVRILFNYFQDK